MPLRNNSMRPPIRPQQTRAPSSASVSRGFLRPGTISPSCSSASLPKVTSKSPAPASSIKRKAQELDEDAGDESNIHVVVRCRGRNDREVRENSGVVVSTEGARGTSVELSMGPNALGNKTYHFDKVFSPAADQAMVYDDVVTPLMDEMLQGYNCTVFAYGQTGTGKTYTMSGDMSDTMGLVSDAAGIIPRVLHSLFRKLEAEEAESSVKCSFIELYNEELRDLLSEEHTKLKMFEDGQKKGHTATIVQGMEESHIKNASEGIQRLQEGSRKRQVAATKCNDLSSRSHTVFTITVYVKRCLEGGEDFISAGKLNLVDLAGSENIQRSGAENKRAAEAGLINKSLLTLGRVINALVDKSSHIPYRESKLTRLLQDSLGGRTKTCIIATVSPARSNLEETISTLDYAFRAKNIRNKPQINQMISKKTLLREFTAEIEKLKGELIATRQRNGVYLSNENYENITVESESRRILSEEQRAKIETMEANLRNKVQELFALTNNFTTLKRDYEVTRQVSEDTSDVLEKTEIVLADTKRNLADETLLRKAHETTEEELATKGAQMITTLRKTVHDVGGLHAKLRRRSDLQSLNRVHWNSSQTQVSDLTRLLDSRIDEFQVRQAQQVGQVSSRVQDFVKQELEHVQTQQDRQADTSTAIDKSNDDAIVRAAGARDGMNLLLDSIKDVREEVKDKLGHGLQELSMAAGRISAEVIQELDHFNSELHHSYNTLGRDFKNIFDNLLDHLAAQRSEANELRTQLVEAQAAVARSDEAISARLKSHAEREVQQRANERIALLSQITDLVRASGSAQDERTVVEICQVREEMATSKADHLTASASFTTSMDAWSAKEGIMMEAALNGCDTLKSKLQTDWTTVRDQNSKIQATTRSVQEETIRIVDTQMSNMASQMEALDAFVKRAKSEIECHHAAQVDSTQGLVMNFGSAQARDKIYLDQASNRLSSHRSDMLQQTSIIEALLTPLHKSIRQPLAQLGDEILGQPILEYEPTGETPQKVTYSYPLSLPRTNPRAFESDRINLEPEVEARELDPSEQVPDSPLEPLLSPNKSIVYADAVDDPAASRPWIVDLTSSLREVAVNINAGGTRVDSKVEDFSSSLMNLSASLMGPPAKRLAIESKAVSKGRILTKGEKENVAPARTRRLRSSTQVL